MKSFYESIIFSVSQTAAPTLFQLIEL